MLEATGSLARSFANRDLRRLQLAWLGSVIGNWGYLVALSVYAYEQGGANAVGLVWVIRLVPAAVLSALLATLADRFARRRVMIVTDLLRAIVMLVAAGVIAGDGPAGAVYALVVVATLVGVPFRPAQAALTPKLVRDAAELSAANVASSTIESVAMFVGPALGGLLLVASTTELVFAFNAATFVWSALLVLGVHAAGDTGQTRERPGFVTELTAGIGVVARDPEVRAISILYTVQTLVAGVLNVLVVLMALELLQTGDAGVGYLNAALGLGGIVGGFVALVLATRGRLASDFGVGLVLFGLPLALLAAVANLPVALLALALVGLGNSIVDVSAITLLQRLVGDEVLGRVLGTLEGMLIGAIGIGALLAPLLADALGIERALLATGLLLPAVTLAALGRLRAADKRAAAPVHLVLLREVPFLAVLPEPVLERLAASATEVTYPPGSEIIRAGDPGDRFYVVVEGEVEVVGRTFVRGASFGEIALLRDVPRTASVAALTPVRVCAIDGPVFIAAVTGHAPSVAAADQVVAARLGSLATRRDAV